MVPRARRRRPSLQHHLSKWTPLPCRLPVFVHLSPPQGPGMASVRLCVRSVFGVCSVCSAPLPKSCLPRIKQFWANSGFGKKRGQPFSCFRPVMLPSRDQHLVKEDEPLLRMPVGQRTARPYRVARRGQQDLCLIVDAVHLQVRVSGQG